MKSKFQPIFSELTLYSTPEKFFLEPKASDELLVIERLTGTIRCFKNNKPSIPSECIKKEICGLLGMIQLLAGPYLVVARKKELVGYIAGCALWSLVKAELVPFRSSLDLSPKKLVDNEIYVGMIEEVLSTPHLYFSYDYDLTHSSQHLHKFSPDFWRQSMWNRVDSRFVWNGHLLSPFKDLNIDRFSLPLILGFVSINHCEVNGHSLTWILISRRSVQRAGARLHVRGIDKKGDVANFVETEQIVEYQGNLASFVQVRGSIPLCWQQNPDLRLNPPPTILNVDLQEQYSLCGKHINDLVKLYGKIVCINLINQRGAEGKIEEAYKNAINNLSSSSVSYEAFDFFAECSNMRYDRLAILIERVSLDQDEMGFFLLRDGSLTSLQRGVFRTNCVDCLDRTNVVQSKLAHRNLEIMFKKLQILDSGQSLDSQDSFDTVFKNVWTDNADIISTQYSGTSALKTDYTRIGKETKIGWCKDFVNALIRYYKNNLTDGYRQDAIDLFLGNGKAISWVNLDKGWKYRICPLFLLIVTVMFVACIILPSEYSIVSLLLLLYLGLMIYATLRIIFKYGSEFVDKPRLAQS